MSLSEDTELQIILPACSNDPLSDMLRLITKAVEEATNEPGGWGLGGQHGYGAPWDSPVFTMRRFYWGDCDCDADERSEAWHSVNRHAPDCYSAELSAGMKAWDARHDYESVYQGAFGKDGSFFGGFDAQTQDTDFGSATVWTPRHDETMDAWRALNKKRDRYRDDLAKRLCKRHGQTYPSGCMVHCTCGFRQRSLAADIGHRESCSLELPNFRHHASGFEVRWYKYIGRDNETINQPADLTPVFTDCMADIAIADRNPTGGDVKQAPSRSDESGGGEANRTKDSAP